MESEWLLSHWLSLTPSPPPPQNKTKQKKSNSRFLDHRVFNKNQEKHLCCKGKGTEFLIQYLFPFWLVWH